MTNRERETSTYQYLFLWTLASINAPVVGNELSERIHGTAAPLGVDVSGASFYVTVKKMRTKGYIEVIKSETDKRARIYSITASGRQHLAESWERLNRIVNEFSPAQLTTIQTR